VRTALALLWLASVCACTSQVAEPWRSGTHHALTVVVRERGPVIPELRASLQPSADSLVSSLIVDSARNDSVFGRWTGNLKALGIPPRIVPVPDTSAFAGRVTSDSVALNLFPGHIDGELYFSGQRRGNEVLGSFSESSPRVAGTFRISTSGITNAATDSRSDELRWLRQRFCLVRLQLS